MFSKLRQYPILSSLIVLAGFAVLAFIFVTPGLKPVIINVNHFHPLIVPQDRVHQLGSISMDSKAETSYVIYNKGGGMLDIDTVDTSCGCTVAEVTKKHVLPGDFTRIKVTMDTSLKMGPTKKCITVHSNDPQTPELKLLLAANVLTAMQGHGKIEVKDPLVLFHGECATCHVMRGKGKVGKDLFMADCAMCHGLNGQGKKDLAPTLISGNYHDQAFMDEMRRIIANGSPDKPAMAPFAVKNGGPLNDAEIDSLMNFLRYQTDQAKAGKLGEADEETCGGLETTPVKN